MRNQKPSKTEVGSRFERRAEAYLLSRGYRVIGRNVRFRCGEIDLVCETNEGTGPGLVLVEVRMRAVDAMVGPEESLIGAKQGRFKRAARMYLSRYRGRATWVRLDLIAVQGERVSHYENFLQEGSEC